MPKFIKALRSNDTTGVREGYVYCVLAIDTYNGQYTIRSLNGVWTGRIPMAQAVEVAEPHTWHRPPTFGTYSRSRLWSDCVKACIQADDTTNDAISTADKVLAAFDHRFSSQE